MDEISTMFVPSQIFSPLQVVVAVTPTSRGIKCRRLRSGSGHRGMGTATATASGRAERSKAGLLRVAHENDTSKNFSLD